VAYQTTPEPPAQQLSNNNERGIIMTVNIFNKKQVDKSSDFDFKSILSKLDKLESELKSTQKSIADVRRDIPFYLSKALQDYSRGYSYP